MATFDRDLARIRLVTQRYPELRGLGACVMVLLAAGMWATRTYFGPGYAIWGIPLGMAFAFPAAYWVERRYDERFGRVKPLKGGSVWPLLFGIWFGLTSVIANRTRGHGHPNAMFLPLAIFSAWIAFRDWPVRGYHLLNSVVVLACSLMYVRVDSEVMEDEWLLTTFTLMSMSNVITGVLDHRLLVRTLGDRSVETTDERA